jgi:predicted PhzF superfamily epimerase YddE/YHI9
MPKAFIVSSFTLNGKGGNKAGVVFDSVTDEEKQQIAFELGFSETVFVEGNRFRYFTPNSEIDFCGHATLAALSLIDYTEMEIELRNFTLKAFKDPLPRFNSDNGVVIQKIIDEEKVLLSLGVNESEIAENGFEIAYTGLADLFVHVKDISSLKPDFALISEVSEELDIVGYHVYADHPDYDATTRNFAPLFGINEESATGSANSGLAYLMSLRSNKRTYKFLQGETMNQESEIIIHIEDSIYISGEASLIDTISVLEDNNVKT